MCLVLFDADNERTNVIASGLVVLHVSAIAQRKGTCRVRCRQNEMPKGCEKPG